MGWLQGLLAPVVALAISATYFVASPKTESLFKRLLVSAHGVSIAVLYFGAMTIFWLHRSSETLEKPFECLLLIPVLLALLSLLLFRGRKRIHWLQILNLLCLVWTAFIGGMAVTDNWL